jgi:hypothetical protein
MADWYGTVLGVVAGGVLTLFSGRLADDRLNRRERERFYEERRERIAVRRSEFQRETLLALQTASQKLLRNTGASLHQDIMAHRKGARWQRQELPNDLSDQQLNWITETILLASRVRDNDVRALTEQFRSQAARVGFSSNETEAESRMLETAATHGVLLERLGALIREIDEL